MGNYLFQDARVYCGTYAKYNDGNLFGKWIDLDDFDDYEEFENCINELHKDEDDPEFMLQDQEGMQCDGEPSISDIKQWYELFKYNTYDIDEDLAYALVEGGHCEWEDVERYYDDHYYLSGSSYEDIAIEYLDNSCAEIPDCIANYIDYEGLGKDLAHDFTEVEANGQIYLFY